MDFTALDVNIPGIRIGWKGVIERRAIFYWPRDFVWAPKSRYCGINLVPSLSVDVEFIEQHLSYSPSNIAAAMSKRDLAFLSTTANVELEPRTKRRKETQSVEKDDVEMADDTKPIVEEGGQIGNGVNGVINEEVKKQGLVLWQTVKDAANTDGQLLSYEFMRLPSKRQYPDYYHLVKRPISLDEIKKLLDQGSYKSLEDVKDDIVHCFTNAKKYNLKNSPIWLDAKTLHKLTKREFLKMTGVKEEDPTDGAGEDAEKPGGEKGDTEGTGDGVKKAKVPNLYRQLKGRLQKLIAKTDDE